MSETIHIVLRTLKGHTAALGPSPIEGYKTRDTSTSSHSKSYILSNPHRFTLNFASYFRWIPSILLSSSPTSVLVKKLSNSLPNAMTRPNSSHPRLLCQRDPTLRIVLSFELSSWPSSSRTLLSISQAEAHRITDLNFPPSLLLLALRRIMADYAFFPAEFSVLSLFQLVSVATYLGHWTLHRNTDIASFSCIVSSRL